MDERATLAAVAGHYGTPAFAYLVEPVRARFRTLNELFGGRFGVSYAVKANPNVALLRAIRGFPATLDVSAIAELERGIQAGYSPSDMTFSGPAKRELELVRAIEAGCGEIVCESEAELRAVDRLSAGGNTSVLLRINPSRMPKQFGVNMAGKPSPFGIDEEEADGVVALAKQLPNVDLVGFHVYSGTNSLSVDAIDENFGIFVDIFARLSREHGVRPRTLVFGSGFGIPYASDVDPLDLPALAPRICGRIDRMRELPELSSARCRLEMGRWLVGPFGWLLTSVVGVKHSRGTAIAMLDAGFNNHLAAAGMMGTVIRRNWPFSVVSGGGKESAEYTLVGPLCTTIDQLATRISLPELAPGDVLAIACSGAYGLTASPTRFISHPEPREILVEADGSLVDATESRLNWPAP